MSDLAFIFRGSEETADLRLIGPDLEGDRELETALTISLFTDARAADDDSFEGEDPRGWWGDTYSENQDKIGSRLWLLAREKQTSQTLNLARQYAQEALAWLVEDGVAEEVSVETQWVRQGVLGLEVLVHRPGISPDRFIYQVQWNQIYAL